MNRRGPSTEPWATPWDRRVVDEMQLLMLMTCFLSVSYYFSQGRAIPMMVRENTLSAMFKSNSLYVLGQ